MSDIRILALNRIFLFTADINNTVSSHVGPAAHFQKYEAFSFLVESLYRLLSSFAINGTGNGFGEDSYVHIVLAPLLELTFDLEPSSNHMWANVSLQESKNLKPDYGLYVNGLSKRFVVLVAEFKPPGREDRMESDLVKIGNEMRFMVGFWSTKHVTVSAYKLEPKGVEVYSMTRLSSIKLFTNVLEFSLIPTITSYLHQLKDITKEAAIKVQDIVRKVNKRDPQHSNIPCSTLPSEILSLDYIYHELFTVL
ncbi:hypothetical protein INT45_010265 [Circinella minor]|uniref:Uncharacterized protein n=1 Tax=Circinella minor TaxID=1195481 RepID=A0A8H7RW13_9FUNG|nr:hypothetical protein INT45_010265 [Circinella minor]